MECIEIDCANITSETSKQKVRNIQPSFLINSCTELCKTKFFLQGTLNHVHCNGKLKTYFMSSYLKGVAITNSVPLPERYLFR